MPVTFFVRESIIMFFLPRWFIVSIVKITNPNTYLRRNENDENCN